MEQDDVLISIPQAAAELGVAPSTIWRHIDRGHLKAQQLQREWAIRRGDFREFQASLPTLPKPGRPRKPPA
jgi:IS30 family transposase